ncbi:MAG: hypothetical protein V1799_12785 [bacterium]
MQGMLDIIGSMLIFGVLILTVARVQQNLNTTLYQSTFNIQTQRNAIELAKQIEFEFTKIGYRVTSNQLVYADSNRIIFKGDIRNTGQVDSIRYSKGTTSLATSSTNPRDFPLIRRSKVSNDSLVQHFGITRLSFAYYDSTNTAMTTPVSSGLMINVRAINVAFRVESFESVYDPVSGDTTWFAVNWQKRIYPRNLSNYR